MPSTGIATVACGVKYLSDVREVVSEPQETEREMLRRTHDTQALKDKGSCALVAIDCIESGLFASGATEIPGGRRGHGSIRA